MEPFTHQATWRTVWTSSFSGFVFGAAVFTAGEASTFLSAGPLHPAALRAAGVLGTAGLGAVLLCAAMGLAALAGLAAGSLSTASGPAAALGAIGAGLLAGTGLQVALSWGTSGRLAVVAASLMLGYATMASSRPYGPAAAECLKYIDARQVMAMLAAEFAAHFAAVFLGMAQGAHLEKWDGRAWPTGLFMMLTILWSVFVLLRVSAAKSLWMALGHVPYYTAINFLSSVFSALAVLPGFLAGVGGVSEAQPESETELVLMLGSAVRAGALSAALLGAALGTVAAVGVGREVAGRVAAGAAMVAPSALRLALPIGGAAGAGSTAGCLLGASVVAGMSLAMASCSSSRMFLTLACSSLGAVLGSGGFESRNALTVLLAVAGGTTIFPYWEDAVALPHDLMLLIYYRDTSVDGATLAALLLAVSSVGAAVLGGAALATAAMGKLGTLGVLLAAVVSLGVTLMERLNTLSESPVEIMGSLMVLLALLSGIEMTYFIQYRP